MQTALLVLDIINELAHPDGVVGREGYYQQALARGVVQNTANMIRHFREHDLPVIYVIVGFSEDYREWSPVPKLFRNVKDKRQVILNTWPTQVHADLAPRDGEDLIIKHRIDPFLNTDLCKLLHRKGVEKVLLSGISTEFVVLSTALGAHDRDFEVVVLEDCVSSSCEQSHQAAMHIIEKVAEVSNTHAVLQQKEVMYGT